MASESTYCGGRIPLMTASYIMGYFQLVVAVCEIITYTCLLINLEDLAKQGNKDIELEDWMLLAAKITYAVTIAFLLVDLMFIALLLVGLHKNKSGLVKTCLVYTYIILVLTIMALFRYMGKFDLATFAINLFWILHKSLFIIVIRSMHREMTCSSGAVIRNVDSETCSAPALYSTPGVYSTPASNTAPSVYTKT